MAGGARAQAKRSTDDVGRELFSEKHRCLRGDLAQRQGMEMGRIRNLCRGWKGGLDNSCEERWDVTPEGSGVFSTQISVLVFRRVECSTPTTPRLLHRRYFCSLPYDLRVFILSSLRVPRFFPQRRCTKIGSTVRLLQERFSLCWDASPPVDAVGRFGPSLSTSCHSNRRHVGISIHAWII